MTADRGASPANRRTRLVWLGILAGLILLGYELSILSVDLRILADDYVEYWSAGRLNLTGGNPYAADQLLPLERAAGRTTEVLMMWNPPYTLALAMPLAVPDYPLSRLIWLLLNIVIVLVATDWSWQLIGGATKGRWLARAVAFTFFPTIIVLRMGQIGPVLLLGIAGFLRYERARRDWLAGAFLALLAIKPHLLYLIWLALLPWAVRGRRWDVLGGAGATLLAATLIALASNPLVIGQYLTATAEDSPLVWMTPTFGSLLRAILGFNISWLQFVPLAPGILWLVFYWTRHRADWQWAARMPLLLLVSVTTTAFGWSFDQVVLLPAVLTVTQRALAVRPRRAAILLALSYIGFNAAAWALFSRVLDFWQIWLAPALLAWYLYACGRRNGSADPTDLADR